MSKLTDDLTLRIESLEKKLHELHGQPFLANIDDVCDLCPVVIKMYPTADKQRQYMYFLMGALYSTTTNTEKNKLENVIAESK